MIDESIPNPWEQISEKEFVSFDKEKNNNVIDIQFIDNNFTPKVSSQYGNLQYEFEVIERKDPGVIKTFSPSSARLMRKLKGELPLEGKWFKIERFGEGFTTDYALAEQKRPAAQEEIQK